MRAYKFVTSNFVNIAKLSGRLDTTFSNNLDVYSGTKAKTSVWESTIF